MTVLEQLLAEIGERGSALKAGSKATSSTPSSPYLHGPNGLWSVAGVERPIISTRLQPRGIAGLLPARPNNSMNPMYGYLTGFTSPTETQPNGVCDDPPTAGQSKNAFQTAVFGRYSYQTRVMDLTRLGQVINRSEPMDLFLVNQPVNRDTGDLTIPGIAGGAQLANEAMMRFTEAGIMFQNKLMKQFWYGNPANNTGGGGYQEFAGVDRLIRTGIRDAITGATVNSLDSLLVDMNYAAVSGTGDSSVVNVLTYSLRQLKFIADRSQLSPVEWVIAMRPALFYEITAVWPCSYMTYRCVFPGQANSGASNNLTVDAGDAIRMRDEMRNGQFLVIDGERVRVVLDDAINELSSGDTNRITNGSFASSMYILPLSVKGGTIASMYWEYFDWNGPNAAMAATNMANSPLLSNFFWSDGGQYLWHFKPPTNWCVQWLGLVVPRIVLITPHLAARIANVQYTPLMHTRDVFPTDPYFTNGGATSRSTAPSFYNSYS